MNREPNELGTLLQTAMSDPLGLLSRILQQVLAQLSADPNTITSSAADAGPEAVIAEAITRRLTGFFAAPDPGSSQDRLLSMQADVQAAYYEEVLDRNICLAAALGACDCWGAAPECPICQGEGTPGWTLPDRELFATYVQPALTKMNDPQQGPTAADAPKEQLREDTNDDRKL
jgi:hypothetical protein